MRPSSDSSRVDTLWLVGGIAANLIAVVLMYTGANVTPFGKPAIANNVVEITDTAPIARPTAPRVVAGNVHQPAF